MILKVDTIEDFLSVREQMEPVYINSKTNGKVLVPCANTILVRTDLVVANSWNPNAVPADRMELLKQSILDNGFAFPVVAIWDPDLLKFVIIDGFHRRQIGGPDWLDFDYIPVAVLDHDLSKRMAATIQFNKARGVHQIDLDAELIRALIEQGLSEDEISVRLGIDIDTIHRYKQITGVAELFAKADYSMSWHIEEEVEND